MVRLMAWCLVLCLAIAGQAAAAPKRVDPVAQAINRIKRSAHVTMPAPQVKYTRGRAGKGMTLVNGTPFLLRFYFKGPVTKTVALKPGKSTDIALVVGRYEVAVEAKATKRNVVIRPFYGLHDYRTNSHYWVKIFIKKAKK